MFLDRTSGYSALIRADDLSGGANSTGSGFNNPLAKEER